MKWVRAVQHFTGLTLVFSTGAWAGIGVSRQLSYAASVIYLALFCVIPVCALALLVIAHLERRVTRASQRAG